MRRRGWCTTPTGRDTWQFRDVVIPNVALNAVAGRPKEEYGLEPQGLDEIRPGCWQVDERVKDMNAGGILGSICFPTFCGFAGRLFATEDPEFSLALVQAYNDWHVEEWCGGVPGTLHPDDPAGHLGRRGMRQGDPPQRRTRRARIDLQREPRRDGLPVLPRRLLDPDVGSARRHRHGDERAHRIVGEAGHHRR